MILENYGRNMILEKSQPSVIYEQETVLEETEVVSLTKLCVIHTNAK